MSDNMFDPLGMWASLVKPPTYESKEELEEPHYIDQIVDQVYDVHGHTMTELVTESVSAGVVAERARCLNIIRTQLKSLEDLGQVIKLIEDKE